MSKQQTNRKISPEDLQNKLQAFQDTVQGKVRFGLPLHALRFYFPALWPEAEADTAAL